MKPNDVIPNEMNSKSFRCTVEDLKNEAIL